MSQTLEALVVELRADVKGLQASLDKANTGIRRFSDQGAADILRLQDVVKRFKQQFTAMALAYGAFSVGKGIVEAGMQMQALEAKMTAATGSADVAQVALQFVREEAERLGIDFRVASEAFSSFSASALRSGLTFKQVQEIFTGVSEATVALKLSSERTQLVFLALTQMASKGVVSMEDLRQQMGESLPGALQVFSKAMGVTNDAFIKMVSNGQVTTADLVKLGNGLRNEFGGAAEEAANSAQAAFARLGNSIFELQAKLADAGILDVVVDGVNQLNKALNDPGFVQGLVRFTEALAAIARIALDVASNLGTALYKIGEFETKALAMVGIGAGAQKQAQTAAKLVIPVKPNLVSPDYTLGKISTPGETDAQKRAREKAERERQQLRERVQGIAITNAGETDPAKQAALEAEKQQKVLDEALAKKAISEQEYRDASLQNEIAYQDKLTDIRQKAADIELGMRDKTLNSIQNLLQVFAGKNKAIAIAMLAFDKARAIAQAIIETHVAAAAALKYDPTGATSAYVTTLGYANVAAIAATGIAQLATMGSGGGGGSSGSSVSSGGASSSDTSGPNASGASAAPPKSVFITLNGDDAAFYSKTSIRKLIETINDAISDGTQLKVAVS